jgi:hypothetical protein
MGLTMTSVLTQELFDAIAAEMLIKADDSFPFLSLAVPQQGSFEAGAKTVTFNQPDLPTGVYTETSRRLTEGTAIDTGSKALTMTTKTLTAREYGGPYSVADAKVLPFGITDKMRKMAKHDLASLIGTFLRRDRNKLVDNIRRADLLTTTNVVTPDASAEGAIAPNVVASAIFLRRLNKAMKDALVPTFPGGRWKLVITTKDEQDLKNDTEIQAAFREFAAANPIITSGQLGSYEGFDIFTDTLMPASAVGAGGAVTGYQSLAFGPYHLGHCAIQEPEPRRADDTDFQRQERVMWISLEAFGLLYGDYVFRGVTT